MTCFETGEEKWERRKRVDFVIEQTQMAIQLKDNKNNNE